MARVLVTGSKGYIGRYVTEAVKKRGHTVICLDHPMHGSGGKHTISQDITQKLSFSTGKIDVLIHLAAVVGEPSERKNHEVNFTGAKHIFDWAVAHKVKQCIFTSSVSAIRKHKGPYGGSKFQAEKYLQKHAGKMSFTVFRPTMVYGDRSQGLTRILKNVHRFPFVVPMVGFGRYLRQPIYVKDLAEAIAEAVLNKKSYNHIYNAGGEHNLSFMRLVKCIMRIERVHKIIVPVPLWCCKILGWFFEQSMKKPLFTREHIRSLSEDTKLDISPMQHNLNFSSTPLKQGLTEAIADWKSDQKTQRR